MSTRTASPSIKPEEKSLLLEQLELHPEGLDKAMLNRLFGNNRKARAVISECVTEGLAPIINVRNESGEPVYRLAKASEIELVDQEVASLLSRAKENEARANGLKKAFHLSKVKVNEPIPLF